MSPTETIIFYKRLLKISNRGIADILSMHRSTVSHWLTNSGKKSALKASKNAADALEYNLLKNTFPEEMKKIISMMQDSLRKCST